MRRFINILRPGQSCVNILSRLWPCAGIARAMGEKVAPYSSRLTGYERVILELSSLICIIKNYLPYGAESDATLPPVVLVLPALHHKTRVQPNVESLNVEV